MNQLAVDIVKRRGKQHTEPFDPTKLHRSLCAALLSVRSPDGQADDTARQATEIVIVWLSNKSSVTSQDIRRKAAEALENLHPEAAYLYNNHYRIM